MDSRPGNTVTGNTSTGSSPDGSRPSEPMTGASLNGSLTTPERLDASTLAQEITRRVLPLKAPMRREVLRQVGWLLGEE